MVEEKWVALWILRPNWLSALCIFQFAIVGWISALLSTYLQRRQQNFVRSIPVQKKSVQLLEREALRRHDPTFGKCIQFLIPSVCVFLFFLWTRITFFVFGEASEFLADSGILTTLAPIGLWTVWILLVLFLVLFLGLYFALGVPFVYGISTIIPLSRFWQVHAVKPMLPIFAILAIGYSVVLSLTLGSIFDDQSLDWGYSIAYFLSPFLMTPLALLILMGTAPLSPDRDILKIFDPSNGFVLSVSCALFVIGILFLESSEVPGSITFFILLISALYNLWAMTWMYRRY